MSITLTYTEIGAILASVGAAGAVLQKIGIIHCGVGKNGQDCPRTGQEVCAEHNGVREDIREVKGNVSEIYGKVTKIAVDVSRIEGHLQAKNGFHS